MTEPAESPVVAVIGAGIMGTGIAQSLALAGCRVRLNDMTEERLQASVTTIEHGRFGLRRGVERGKVTAAAADEALARITTTTSLEDACAGVDLAIEAVPEDLTLKCDVFRRLDRAAPPAAILTSNAAGLPITALAWATGRPERVLGWHWAQPVAVIRLAELVAHPRTAQDAIDYVSELARRCGKNPIVVKDQPDSWGYVANRINRAVRLEARRVVDEGVASEDQVDEIMRDCFRWPMGPFEMQRPGSM